MATITAVFNANVRRNVEELYTKSLAELNELTTEEYIEIEYSSEEAEVVRRAYDKLSKRGYNMIRGGLPYKGMASSKKLTLYVYGKRN